MGKFLLSTLLLLTTAFASTAAEETIEITPNSFGKTDNKYVTDAFEFTADGVTFKTNQVNPTSGQIKVNATGTSAFYLYNTSELPGNIISITLETDQTTFGTWAVASGDQVFSSAITANNSKSTYTVGVDKKSGTWTLTSEGKYFGLYLTTKGSGTVKFSRILITYEESGDEPATPTKCGIPVAKIGGVTVENNGKYFVNDELTLSCTPQDATIRYSLLGDEFEDLESTYSNPIKLTKAGNYILTATATKDQIENSEELELLFIVNKHNPEISYNKATAKAYLDAISEFTAPELLNPNNLEGMSYTSSNENVASIALDGTVTPLSVGKTTITATFDGNDVYEGVEVKYVLTVKAVKPTTMSDVLTSASDCFNITGTTYADKEYTSTITNITYKANLAGDKESIQLRSSNSNSGIVIIANQNGYILRKISLDWNDETATDRTIDVYGKNSAYESAANLYATKDNDSQGLNLGSIGRNATSLDIDGDYAFIGIRSKSGAVYLSKIILEWGLALPEIHEDCHSMLTEGAITKEGNLKFADVAEGIDLWYKLEQNQSANALAEVDAAHEHGTEGYTKYDPATGIEITKNHVGHTLTVFACDAAKGIDSEPVSYAVTVSTGVEEIEAAGAGEVRWFDMQGREVKGQPEKGIYVRVVNGKASKVIL